MFVAASFKHEMERLVPARTACVSAAALSAGREVSPALPSLWARQWPPRVVWSLRGCMGTMPPSQSTLYSAASHSFCSAEIRIGALWLQPGLSELSEHRNGANVCWRWSDLGWVGSIVCELFAYECFTSPPVLCCITRIGGCVWCHGKSLLTAHRWCWGWLWATAHCLLPSGRLQPLQTPPQMSPAVAGWHCRDTPSAPPVTSDTKSGKS